MSEKYSPEVSKYVETEGLNIGRTKVDSPEAYELTRKMADQEQTLRGPKMGFDQRQSDRAATDIRDQKIGEDTYKRDHRAYASEKKELRELEKKQDDLMKVLKDVGEIK